MNSMAVSVSQPNNGDCRWTMRNFSRTNMPFNPQCCQPQAVLFKLRLPLSFWQVAWSKLVGKALVEDQQGQSRPLSRPKAAHPKHFSYKDLVLIPSPRIKKVPTRTTRLQLEERELACFDKSWDANSLKGATLNRFPKLLLFEYIKVGNFALVL